MEPFLWPRCHFFFDKSKQVNTLIPIGHCNRDKGKVMNLVYYDSAPAVIAECSVFLAGPTTDGAGEQWVGDWKGHKLSRWRADLARELDQAGYMGTLVVPEFSKPGDFKALAAEVWPQQPSGPRSAPLLWEDRQLEKATIVALWMDVGLDGPARGLSARPEASELFFRSQLPPGSWTWRVQRLVYGAPTSAKKVGRFAGFAADLGMPVWRSLPELARAIVAACPK